ncbi:MAG: hypothetical protein IJ122_06145 [Methanobrevibacter sp.]|nr:hypothetical protein [Methanobrevibacter sp.]
MATYTLTTSPQEVGINTTPTVGARLLAWYSDQSGNSAKVHLKLQAISQGTTYTGTNKDYELTLGDVATGTVSWTYAPLPADKWVDVKEIEKSVSGGTTLSVSGKVWTYMYDDAWITGNSVKLNDFYTSPTGLGADQIVPSTRSFTANVYISDWGTGSGTKYRELQCWTYDANNFVEPRRYQAVTGSSKSGTITVSNSSSGSLTIIPNTRYTLGIYASNGSAATGSQRLGNYYTDPELPTFTVLSVTETSAVIRYQTKADGGARVKYLQYKMDDRWTVAATVGTGTATTGTFTITGLTPGTHYSLPTRLYVFPSARTFFGEDIVFSTLKKMFYGSIEGKTKCIEKMYASVYNGTSYSISTATNVTAFNGETMHSWIKNNSPKVYARINDIRQIKVINTQAGYYSANVIAIDKDSNEYLMAQYITSDSYLHSMGITFKTQGQLTASTDLLEFQSSYVTKHIKKLYGSVNNVSQVLFVD